MHEMILHLREAAWLHAKRARTWCSILAVMTVLSVLVLLATSHGNADMSGKPIGTDFISFWTASRFALDGHPDAVYQPVLHQAAEYAMFPRLAPGYAAFFYPPTFLLLCLPLAFLPYLPALAVWLVAGLAVLVAGLRRILPQHWAILPMLAFPAVLDNLGHGQNAFVTAGCFAWSAVLRGRRPFLAGACLGLLVIKPHLLIAAPIALLAGREWRMIAGGLVSGCALIFLSWAAFGSQVWVGFLQNSALARTTLEQGIVDPGKMQSVFTAVRLLHGNVALGYALQAAVGILVLSLLAWLVWRRPDPVAQGALLALATMLCTPFLLDYDFVCLAIPLAWVTAEAQRMGWRSWEKTVLLASYLLPLVARPLAMTTGIGIAPVVIGMLLAVTLRRAVRISAVSPPLESYHVY
jgi:alpha-1,2-mannosyltransferase